MTEKIKFVKLTILVSWLLLSPVALASKMNLPTSLAQDILSDTVPSALPISEITAAHFAIVSENQTEIIESVVVEKESLQWVRMMDVLVLPRGRARIRFKAPVSVQVEHAGYSTGGKQVTSIDFPIVLTSNPSNSIKVQIEYQGQLIQVPLSVRFRAPEGALEPLMIVDSSCSRYSVKTQFVAKSKNPNQWAYVGCRFVSTASDEYRKSLLELYVFWDTGGDPGTVSVDSFTVQPILPSVWAFRLNSMPNRLSLNRNGNRELSIEYSLSDQHSLGFLGLGLGPYFSEFNGVGEHDLGWSPLLTLYGSFFINESLRLVAFDATSVSNRLWTDFGLYLSTENAKMFDQRMTMNLLFGGHIMGFRTNGETHAVPSFPQGFEFIFVDAFKRGYNMSLGGFIYPEINGRSYYNLWWRWGGRIFGEINYLAAKESFNDQSVSSKSLGVTFGFPIMKFW